MNKKTIAIIVAVIAVLAVAGVAIAINMNNNASDDANNQSNQTSNNETPSGVDPSKEFNPQPLNELSYVATTKTTVSGQTVESTTESDGKGTTKSSSSFGGMTTESYVKGNTVVTCVDGECSTSTVDTTSEEATSLAQDASQYKDSAKHSGTEACPAGTCQVWKASGPAGDVTYYVDDENRISKVVMSDTGAEMVYEYKDVSITIPTV
ncbi:MAG: hypothetical protein ACREGE_03975 [Candidatus Microsaccharimonas sp.]